MIREWRPVQGRNMSENYFCLLFLLFRIIGKDTLNINLMLFKAREFNRKAKRRAKPRKPRKAHD